MTASSSTYSKVLTCLVYFSRTISLTSELFTSFDGAENRAKKLALDWDVDGANWNITRNDDDIFMKNPNLAAVIMVCPRVVQTV